MSFPYSWTPKRVIPTSTSQVKVYDVDGKPAIFSVPVVVSDGTISFAVQNEGYYIVRVRGEFESEVDAFTTIDPTPLVDTSLSQPVQDALALKAPINNPTFTGMVQGILKSHVGLGSVNNTSDTDKPISTLQAEALAQKAPINNPSFTGTVSGVTKSAVGLGNVDDTADTEKPVSTPQQTALNAKASLVGTQDIEITDIAKGIIIKSPNGTRFRIQVANDGALTTTSL